MEGAPATNYVANQAWGTDNAGSSFIQTVTDTSLQYKNLPTSKLVNTTTAFNCYINGGNLNQTFSSTDWTFTCYIRRADKQPIPALATYLYSFSSDNAPATVTALEDGWYRVYRTKTGTTAAASLAGFTGLLQNVEYYVSGACLTPTSYPVDRLGTNTTRSNTQAILDLTGKSTITATSPTYNSNGTFSFTGGTERLDISNTIGPISNNFSISAWVNSTNIAATQNIVSMNGPYFMRIDGSKVRFNVLAGGTWLFQPGTTTLSSNTWYNFTMVYNYDSSLWIGYINGMQEFSVAKTGTVASSSFYGYVGYTPQGGEQSNFFGQIAAVQYYNRALSATEVTQNFEAVRGRYGI